MTAVPRITDNDRDEITATLDGKEIRGWSYTSDAERRAKMLAAHEFAEGYYQAVQTLTLPAAGVMDEMVDAGLEAAEEYGTLNRQGLEAILTRALAQMRKAQ